MQCTYVFFSLTLCLCVCAIHSSDSVTRGSNLYKTTFRGTARWNILTVLLYILRSGAENPEIVLPVSVSASHKAKHNDDCRISQDAGNHFLSQKTDTILAILNQFRPKPLSHFAS